MLTEAPINPVFALGGGGCVNCTLGFRSPRWEIELDGSFTTISADAEPDDCNCMITETRLCFQDVTADIVSSYRCQIQRDTSTSLVECDFQVQLASECVGFDGGYRVVWYILDILLLPYQLNLLSEVLSAHTDYSHCVC